MLLLGVLFGVQGVHRLDADVERAWTSSDVSFKSVRLYRLQPLFWSADALCKACLEVKHICQLLTLPEEALTCVDIVDMSL